MSSLFSYLTHGKCCICSSPRPLCINRAMLYTDTNQSRPRAKGKWGRGGSVWLPAGNSSLIPWFLLFSSKLHHCKCLKSARKRQPLALTIVLRLLVQKAQFQHDACLSDFIHSLRKIVTWLEPWLANMLISSRTSSGNLFSKQSKITFRVSIPCERSLILPRAAGHNTLGGP